MGAIILCLTGVPGPALGAVVPAIVAVDAGHARVSAIAAGGAHTCAVIQDGSIRCWGANFNGQLGTGQMTAGGGVPVEAIGLSGNLRAVAAGESHTCAISSGGDAWCWGWNAFGQLGTGSAARSSALPTGVLGIDGRVRAIAAGQFHSCVIVAGDEARCWGANRDAGQLGSGTTTNHPTPVAVVGLGEAASISPGSAHTCALVGRHVECWGANRYGELGDGTRALRRTPVVVDFATHQRVTLSSTAPAGSLAAGTAVTFDARATPVPPGTGAAIRFEIYRRDGTVWRLAARRDVPVDATGRASLRWTFVTTGGRSVRALALANAVYAASPWSPRIVYTVE